MTHSDYSNSEFVRKYIPLLGTENNLFFFLLGFLEYIAYSLAGKWEN